MLCPIIFVLKTTQRLPFGLGMKSEVSKRPKNSWVWWCTPVIIAIQETQGGS
jgi:hypothetical protein